MTFRKQTSLMLILGLMASLLHPLVHDSVAHAGPSSVSDIAALHKASLTTIKVITQSDQTAPGTDTVNLTFSHQNSDFVVVPCKVCHGFTHIFLPADPSDLALVANPRQVLDLGSVQLKSGFSLFEHPPRLLG